MNYRVAASNEAAISEVFTVVLDLVKFFNRRFLPLGWTETELADLERFASKYLLKAFHAFSRNPPTKMRTSKPHALDPMVNSPRQVGMSEFLHGSLYENSQKPFKEDSKMKFRRKCAVINETLRRETDRLGYSGF